MKEEESMKKKWKQKKPCKRWDRIAKKENSRCEKDEK